MSYATQMRSLADYNRWANERMLAVSDALSDEEFAAVDADGLSVEGVLGHAVRAQIHWLGKWTGAEVVDYDHSRDGLRLAYADTHARIDALVASTDETEWARMFDFSFQQGPRHRLPMWQTVEQVVLNGVQHRAETAVLLTRAGHSPGNMDYIWWLGRD